MRPRAHSVKTTQTTEGARSYEWRKWGLWKRALRRSVGRLGPSLSTRQRVIACWRLVRFVGDSQTVVVRKPAGNFTRHHMPMADGQEDMAFGHSYAGMLLAFYQLPDARQGIRADDGIGIALEDDSGDPSAVEP